MLRPNVKSQQLARRVFLLLVLTLSLVQAQPPQTINITIAAIRLSNPQLNQTSTTGSGLVEVQLDGGGNIWGSICGKYRTPQEINLVCQMMEYRDGQQTLQGNYGVGSKNYLLENMTCPVYATSLDNCTHYLLKTCGPQDDELYVNCNPTSTGGGYPFKKFFTPSNQPGSPSLSMQLAVLTNQTQTHVCAPPTGAINVRIFSGAGDDTYGMGYVQLYINGRWTFVCQENWNQAAAIVACKEMCFSDLGSAQNFVPQPGIVRNYVPNPVNPLIGASDVSCTGIESSIFNCTFSTSPGLCLQTAQPTLAGIQCLPQNNTRPVIPYPAVTCGASGLSADFPYNVFPYITIYNVDFVPMPPSNCVNKTTTSTLFRISVSVNSSCGTVLKENTTHLTYENTIRYVWLNNNDKSYQYVNQRYQLICSIPKTNVVTNRYQPYTLSPLNNLYGNYDFSLKLELYNSNTFQTPVATIGGTYLVEVGDWINAAVVLKSIDSRLKVVIVDCDALPVMPMAVNVPVEKLIHNKSTSHPSLSMYEIDNFKQGFRFQAILFSGYSLAYIKCTANICLATDSSCKRMGGTRRKKRQAGDSTVDAQVQSFNILFYNPQSQDFLKLKSQLTSEEDITVENSSPNPASLSVNVKNDVQSKFVDSVPALNARYQADLQIAEQNLHANTSSGLVFNYLLIFMLLTMFFVQTNMQ